MVYLKRGASAVIFVAGLIFLLIVTSHIFIPKNNSKESGMEEVSANGILGEKENTIDVLILGDSESYSSITPMEIWKENGYTSYVCGTSLQMLDYSNIMLNRAFEKQKPKIVILETNAIYRNIKEEITGLSELGERFSVFRYHNRWKSLKLSDFDFGREIKYTQTDNYKGYHYNVKVNPSKKKEYMVQTENIAEIPGQNVEYVKAMKEFCDKNNAEFILLSTPSTRNWNYERHNGINKLAEELGCEYIDLNLQDDRISIDWNNDTRDRGDHLNYFGAVKVTGFLSDYLKEKNVLTDHRNDERYSKWNEDLLKYEESVY